MAQCLDLKQFEGDDLKSVIGGLMEESGLPLSKLVDEVFGKLKVNEGFGDVTLATVKKIVLLVGQREMYGMPNADADVLEDDSELCLWCWETRDLKLMPASVRGVLNIRRTCRRKIHERITAISVNSNECLMTRFQEMSLDYHFTIEQEVGSSTHAFFGFNGNYQL